MRVHNPAPMPPFLIQSLPASVLVTTLQGAALGFTASAPSRGPRWHTRLRGPCFAAALVLPSRAGTRRFCVVGDVAGWLHCLCLSDGAARWSTCLGAPVVRQPAVGAASRALAVPLQTGDVVVLSESDGAQLARLSPTALRGPGLKRIVGASGGAGASQGHAEAVGTAEEPWPAGSAALTPTFCDGDRGLLVGWSSGAMVLVHWPAGWGKGCAGEGGEAVVVWAAVEGAQVYSAPLLVQGSIGNEGCRVRVVYGSRGDALVGLCA